jgi:hypothetical protein
MPFPTKVGFRQFLTEHYDEPVGYAGLSKECPLAECLKARGYQDVVVSGLESWWHEIVAPDVAGGARVYKECKTPKWAVRFMDLIDATSSFTKVTGREALKFLD